MDDSTIIVDRLHNMLRVLENAGTIRQAGDYSTATTLLTESQPDLVLLDINLPGRSGIALLQYIKSVYPSILVIMITNQADDYYRKICHRLGADHFVDKSRDFEQIPSIISSLL
ncbi:MAG TPA: response regulator [Puia sp.]|nr:response regulator [Puia sp.]